MDAIYASAATGREVIISHFDRERSTVERVNGRLKDEFGARQVRVRGHSKVRRSEEASGISHSPSVTKRPKGNSGWYT